MTLSKLPTNLQKVRQKSYEISGDQEITKDMIESINELYNAGALNVTALGERIDVVEQAISDTNGDVSDLLTDMGTAQGDISDLTTDVGTLTTSLARAGYKYINVSDGNSYAPIGAAGPWDFNSVLLASIVELMPNAGDAVEFKFQAYALDSVAGVLKFRPITHSSTNDCTLAVTTNDKIVTVTLTVMKLSSSYMLFTFKTNFLDLTAGEQTELEYSGVQTLSSITSATHTGFYVTWTWTSVPDAAGLRFVFSSIKVIPSLATPQVIIYN